MIGVVVGVVVGVGVVGMVTTEVPLQLGFQSSTNDLQQAWHAGLLSSLLFHLLVHRHHTDVRHGLN